MDRKIKGKPIFNEKNTKKYFEGLNMIYSAYFDISSVKQGQSKKSKEIDQMANDWLVLGRDYCIRNYPEYFKKI